MPSKLANSVTFLMKNKSHKMILKKKSARIDPYSTPSKIFSQDPKDRCTFVLWLVCVAELWTNPDDAMLNLFAWIFPYIDSSVKCIRKICQSWANWFSFINTRFTFLKKTTLQYYYNKFASFWLLTYHFIMTISHKKIVRLKNTKINITQYATTVM